MNPQALVVLMDKYAVSYARLLNMSIKDSAFVETDLATIKLRNDVIAALQARDQVVAEWAKSGIADFYEDQFAGCEAFGPAVAEKIRTIEIKTNLALWQTPRALPGESDESFRFRLLSQPVKPVTIDVNTATGAHLDLIAQFSNHPKREEGETDDAFRKRMLVYKVPVTVEIVNTEAALIGATLDSDSIEQGEPK